MPTPDDQPDLQRKTFLTFPRIFALASILLFLLSLTQNAFFVEDTHQQRSWVSSLLPLFIGWLGVLELCFAWFANPLLLIAWIALPFRSGRILALCCAILAFALALSVLFVRPLLYGDNDSAKILQYGAGYYLWLASIATALIGALVPIVHRKLPPQNPAYT